MRVGIIGYGSRMRLMVDLMQRLSAGTVITAITELDPDATRRNLAEHGIDPTSVHLYTDADEMLCNEELDGVMIGTRCSSHARLAIKVLARNLPLFLEKPVATNMDDLCALREAAKVSLSPVVVSFPLRVTPIIKLAKEIIDSGKIGSVEHVQAINNVPYGYCYYMGWYRDENETQGLWLQKATHDFDYINYLLQARPISVAAISSKRVYKGDKPAGLRCAECKDWDTCIESPYHLYYSRSETERVENNDRFCGFAQDTGNEDCGSAIVEYENGVHASYSQNFLVRRGAAKRGAILIGYKGTIEFDWYRDELTVHMHHTPRVETYKIDSKNASHGGGDIVLVDNFVRLMRGEGTSVAPLEAGITSALLCLKAKQAAMERNWQEVRFPD